MTATPAFYPGLPTVDVSGRRSAVLETSMLSLVVAEETDGLFTCEATFHNAGVASGGVGFPLFDRQVIDFGSDFVVRAGVADSHGQLFAGRVTGLEASFPQDGTAELTVFADDRLQDLRMTRRTRLFEDMTDAEIVDGIAAEHGLTADATISGPSHRVVAQLDQSDLAFIRERASRSGAEIWLEGTTLHVAARQDRRSEPISCSHRQNLREARLRADLTSQHTRVAVSGWNPSAKEAIDVSAGGEVLSAERSGGATSGFEILEGAFGDRPERLVHAVPLDVGEAQELADARFRRQARRFVSGEILVDGDARVRVGATVELLGIGPWFTGTYDVVCVQHLFDLDDGFRTVAMVERSEVNR